MHTLYIPAIKKVSDEYEFLNLIDNLTLGTGQNFIEAWDRCKLINAFKKHYDPMVPCEKTLLPCSLPYKLVDVPCMLIN